VRRGDIVSRRLGIRLRLGIFVPPTLLRFAAAEIGAQRCSPLSVTLIFGALRRGPKGRLGWVGVVHRSGI
jgi:hypothetical protein